MEENILINNNLIGVVVDNNDPIFSGRCRVKVYGVFDNTKTDMIPWATPINSTVFGGSGSGSISIPKIGAIVRVSFNGGDIYAPEYSCIQNIDGSLKKAIQDDYIGTHVLLYDEDANIHMIYQNNSGITIYYKGSFINISPSSMITIQHANGESVIQLDGGTINIGSTNDIKITTSALVDITADEVKVNGKDTTKIGDGTFVPALLSDVVLALLTQMATNIDAKFPSTPGVNTALVKTAMNSAVSTNVLISK